VAALLASLAWSACALQSWTMPQPHFRTKQPAGAWARAVAATAAHCGGVRSVNEESGVLSGPWVAWTTGEGLILTQCLVSLLNGDEHVLDVRVTFAARKCPRSDLADLDALLPSCEFAETVPEQVKNGLVITGEALEADIAR